MPNLLAHFGVGIVASRAVGFDPSDLKWICAGCVIPDLPWIFHRALGVLPFEIESVSKLLYFIAAASLANCLLLSAALALFTTTPQRIFAILGFNVVIHFFLDMCQTKWGSAAHLLAPISWESENFELFWPESWFATLLTVFGFVVTVVVWWRNTKTPTKSAYSGTRRPKAALVLLMAYVLLPIVLMDDVYQSNTKYIKTLGEPESRAGKPIELDRIRYHGKVKPHATCAGETFELTGIGETDSFKISLRGVFVDSDTIQVVQWHRHAPLWRDGASIVALFLFTMIWIPWERIIKRTWRVNAVG